MLAYNSGPHIEGSRVLCTARVDIVGVLVTPHAMVLDIRTVVRSKGRFIGENDASSEVRNIIYNL